MKDYRSPLAKARDKWLDSEEGNRMQEGTTSGAWLRNRLVLAFIAGANAAEKIRKKKGKR